MLAARWATDGASRATAMRQPVWRTWRCSTTAGSAWAGAGADDSHRHRSAHRDDAALRRLL